ncbi:MAG: hypothetical protein AAFQ21_14545 [Pseudomonadota bacterium]
MSTFFWFSEPFVIGAHLVAGTLGLMVGYAIGDEAESEIGSLFLAVFFYLTLLIIYTAAGLVLMVIVGIFV